MSWFYRARTSFTHPPNTRKIKDKDGSEAELGKLCEQLTPPCDLNPMLFNGHAQTIWTAAKPEGPPVYYKRKIFDADHKTYQGTFAVDFVSEPFEDHDKTLPPRTGYLTDAEFDALRSEDTKPMLFVLHGLSGGSYEIYLRHTIAPLIGDGGWDICVVNSRGCANSKITSGVLYNARATWDIRQVLNWAKDRYPNRPFFGLGFSLGASMMTNYCGEEGSNCMLQGAVVCSNPFNLEICSKVMQNRLVGKQVYLRVMGKSMRALAEKHRESLEKYTKLDLKEVQNGTYLHDFDRSVQCPTWGYPTEYAYYRDASSTDAVLSIQIPFLAINAEDDPIAVREALPYEEFKCNPSTVLLTTSWGGHLAWFELGGGRWHPRPVCNFLNHLAFKADKNSLGPLPAGQQDSSEVVYAPMRRKLAVIGTNS